MLTVRLFRADTVFKRKPKQSQQSQRGEQQVSRHFKCGHEAWRAA